MITVEREYHFYAAHRNETLKDKCRNIHGHTYRVTVGLLFEDTGNGGVTMLFSDIDDFICPIIKQLDHTFIIHDRDPLFPVLLEFNFNHPECPTTLYPFVGESSVEHLAKHLYHRIEKTLLPVEFVKVKETDSSIVTYHK